VLGISPVAGGGEGYYIDAVAQGVDEYYRGVGEAPGQWTGTAADLELGLDGEVGSDDLRAVWSGLDPRTGEQLGRFTNRKIGGFDLCWRAPKSVSLLFAFGYPETSRVVREAHDAAVAEAFRYLEANAAGTRKGYGGLQMEPVDGFAAAMFRHRTSRAGDPHLHTHVLIANMVRAADGQWRTLDGRLLYHHAKTAGYLYQAHLRHELTVRLGVEWQPVVKGTADLVGIDRAVIWQFSERRQQIIEHMDKVGFRSARAAQVATLATRPDKTTPADGAIRDIWEAKAAAIGLNPGVLADLLDVRPRRSFENFQVVGLFNELAGPEGLTEMASTFDRRDVLQAIAAGLRTGAPAGLIEEMADVFVARADIVALGEGSDFAHLMRYSTVELLRLEERLIAGALGRVVEGTGIVPEWAIDDALRSRPTMAAEQVEMVRRLCLDGGGVSVAAAAAGTGKTFALDAARDAWEARGYRVVGAALAAKAARELEAATGIPSSTLHKLTSDLERGRVRLDAGYVIVVDEAGMAGTRRLAPILDAAQAVGAKVVLAGDPRQLPEIEAGGMLNALSQLLDPITLAENRRQRDEWEREALDELRSGDVERALDAFEAHGRLITGPNALDVRQTMVDDWWAARQGDEQVVMLAIRRSDVDDLNGRARLHLETAGIVHGPELDIEERPYQAGDEIICLWNDYRLGVRNGDRGTVDRVDADHRTMRVRMSDGVRTLPTEYLDAGYIAHAYATTIHKAQGATVDRSLVLGSDDLYREAGYVALSRGRTANVLYAVGATEVEQDLTHAPQRGEQREPRDLVREALSRGSHKQLAIETVAPLHDWGIGASERRRLLADIEALDGRPSPAPSDDLDLGLERDL